MKPCPVCDAPLQGARCGSCGLERVLDHGFVRLVDFMGGDAAVVQAARVSYGQGSKGEEKDRKLIRFLMMHDHGTPFEMAVFKFHVKAPLFVARQWFRHRIGSFNEISGRYTVYDDTEFYLPEMLRRPTPRNRQASEPAVFPQEERLRTLMEQAIRQAFAVYQELLAAGVARELARIVVPMATYTQFYWGVNARSLMNFLRLRLAPDAQWEIRQFARAVWTIFEEKMPWTAETFLERHPELREALRELSVRA